MTEFIIDMRLKIASWLIGKHAMVQNVELMRDGQYGVTVRCGQTGMFRNVTTRYFPCAIRVETNSKTSTIGQFSTQSPTEVTHG